MLGQHGLLGLERHPRIQDARARHAEGHAPGLNKTSPGILGTHPLSRRALTAAAGVGSAPSPPRPWPQCLLWGRKLQEPLVSPLEEALWPVLAG
jgi:hypothetical protein